jgi:hypothetical protein
LWPPRSEHNHSSLPLGGCSFDLGSWGSDKEKPQAAEQKPTGTIGGQSVGDAQGHVTRGQTLAKSGKTEEALAEFDRALALDPYNVRPCTGLIYQVTSSSRRLRISRPTA